MRGLLRIHGIRSSQAKIVEYLSKLRYHGHIDEKEGIEPPT